MYNAGVTCSPTPWPALGYLKQYNLKSDDVMFTMVTKIEQSRDVLYLVPSFTGKMKVVCAMRWLLADKTVKTSQVHK